MKQLTQSLHQIFSPQGHIFQGWWLVGAGGLVQFTGAILFFQAFGAYFLLIEDEFGWSKALLAGAFFGAMEIMLPVMTTGMLAGMVVPMAAAMADHTFADGLWLGVLCGIVVLAATYAANTIIKRKADQWTS